MQVIFRWSDQKLNTTEMNPLIYIYIETYRFGIRSCFTMPQGVANVAPNTPYIKTKNITTVATSARVQIFLVTLIMISHQNYIEMCVQFSVVIHSSTYLRKEWTSSLSISFPNSHSVSCLFLSVIFFLLEIKWDLILRANIE